MHFLGGSELGPPPPPLGQILDPLLHNVITCLDTFMSFHQPGSGKIVETMKIKITPRN